MPDHSSTLELLPGDVPERGELRSVAPGLFWLRMPLPLALDHVNLWVLEDGPGWCIIDTGLNTAELQSIWTQLLSGPLSGRPVTQLIVTHYHPDHAGLAGWLWQQSRPDERPNVVMSTAEYLMCKALQLDSTDGHRDQIAAFYTQAGMPADRVAFYRKRGNVYRQGVHDLPAPYVHVDDGQVLDIGGRQWQVIKGGGHALDMIMLHCLDEGLFISADQVLPFISPNVSVWPIAPYADPLTIFQSSLMQLQTLPRDCLVLPCHGVPFYGLHERISELLAHHKDRLADTLAACAGGVTAEQILSVLFDRPLDEFQRLFAVGETLAHLNHLVAAGELDQQEGAGSPWIFSPAN